MTTAHAAPAAPQLRAHLLSFFLAHEAMEVPQAIRCLGETAADVDAPGILVLGQETARYWNFDAYDYGAIDRLNRFLSPLGCYAEDVDGYHAVVYPIMPLVLPARLTRQGA